MTPNSELSTPNFLFNHLKYLMKHRLCQPSGLGVLLAWMVGHDKRDSSDGFFCRNFIHLAVTKGDGGDFKAFEP